MEADDVLFIAMIATLVLVLGSVLFFFANSYV